jgi:hypothetical protein
MELNLHADGAVTGLQTNPVDIKPM